MEIPVIDMEKFGLREGSDNLIKLSECLDQAFTKTGCARLINHGITTQQIQNVYAGSSLFFNLPDELKNRCRFVGEDSTVGYIGLGTERYGEKQDLHEGYLIRTAEDLPGKDLPGKDLVPGWRMATESLHTSLKILSSVILDALSLAIGKERDYLASLHRSEGDKKSFKVLRMAHYPPTNPDAAQTSIRFDEHCDFNTFTLLLQDNMGGLQVRWQRSMQAHTSIRIDEHCDFCTFTFLIQDNMGGLQGRDKDGNWFDLTPEPDSIILMAAQFIQFYSNEKYKALRHRVIIPEEEAKCRHSRYSIIYFVTADGHIPAWPTTATHLPQPPPNVHDHLMSVLVNSVNPTPPAS
ncbi:hypothetical protein Pcinc_018468 [Petrolisthes cinctipes]|uniref:Fe2OG dioxygenase domain-containing protein n=1 Tax=Petrolisthes cinctipes TaxID=88211 RepID=A0AAE1KMQ9_PETCI|nr:hypothetical protein Pcinc_018468 [Petrolisthes cinctipes]